MTATAINWPQEFLPGTTDNFVSNEVIVKGITTDAVWAHLMDISKWETYYDNVGQITPPTDGKFLTIGDSFSFSTFGFPPLSCKVYESTPPAADRPGRLAWRAKQDTDDKSKFIDVYHAWIVEELKDGRVRILTQESQIGQPAAELAKKRPNPMLNGHQDWLDGLVRMAQQSKP